MPRPTRSVLGRIIEPANYVAAHRWEQGKPKQPTPPRTIQLTPLLSVGWFLGWWAAWVSLVFSGGGRPSEVKVALAYTYDDSYGSKDKTHRETLGNKDFSGSYDGYDGYGGC